jgi:hypothetical protein
MSRLLEVILHHTDQLIHSLIEELHDLHDVDSQGSHWANSKVSTHTGSVGSYPQLFLPFESDNSSWQEEEEEEEGEKKLSAAFDIRALAILDKGWGRGLTKGYHNTEGLDANVVQWMKTSPPCLAHLLIIAKVFSLAPSLSYSYLDDHFLEDENGFNFNSTSIF